MEPKIRTLTIDRFRAFHHLKIEGLGRVNLITGRNNTGKSSVLEALRILAADANPSVIYDIINSREEYAGELNETNGLFPWSSLFSGFPAFSTNLDSITIASTNGRRPMTLSLEVGWFTVEYGEDRTSRRIFGRADASHEGEVMPRMVITTDGVSQSLPFDHLGTSRIISPFREKPRLPCEFVSAYAVEQTSGLGRLWDKTALSDNEKHMVNALRIIDADISGVSMVGGEGRRETRTAIVRSTKLARPIPLRSYGDGMYRLFGIVLSLVNAMDGLLLIDEFENGMHHTVQADAWRVIFKLASRLDIQVVATSHSWDAIEAFQKAASESPEEGVLIRLARKGDDIIPTVFREDELAIATRDRIEVR